MDVDGLSQAAQPRRQRAEADERRSGAGNIGDRLLRLVKTERLCGAQHPDSQGASLHFCRDGVDLHRRGAHVRRERRPVAVVRQVAGISRLGFERRDFQPLRRKNGSYALRRFPSDAQRLRLVLVERQVHPRLIGVAGPQQRVEL
jgi:hypothetical protein